MTAGTQREEIARGQLDAAAVASATKVESDARFDAIERRLGQVEKNVVDNTVLTQEIRDAIVAAKLGFKVIGGIGLGFKWAGGIAAAGMALYAALYAMTHGGIGPK